jgi:polysaccharide biosynthesis/export protein
MQRVPLALAFFLAGFAVSATAQQPEPKASPAQEPYPTAYNGKRVSLLGAAQTAVTAPTPPDYVIGPDDVLNIYFWRDKDMSGEVVVRPDGKISIPLINDVDVVGLTPDQLRVKLEKAAGKFLEETNATVVVKAINSRKVFITGQVAKPGPYPLMGATTVLQAIAMAGGLQEYADRERILVLRTVNGLQVSYRVNYKNITKQKDLWQNLELKSGDTVVVP